MPLPVLLRDVVDALEMQLADTQTFMNRATGEIVNLADQYVSAAEEGAVATSFADWEREQIAEASMILQSGSWLTPPGAFEINDYSIMERFCESIVDDDLADQLLRAIRGTGAFRAFKDTIHRLGLKAAWHRFKAETFERIAADWLESNGIPYRR